MAHPGTDLDVLVVIQATRQMMCLVSARVSVLYVVCNNYVVIMRRAFEVCDGVEHTHTHTHTHTHRQWAQSHTRKYRRSFRFPQQIVLQTGRCGGDNWEGAGGGGGGGAGVRKGVTARLSPERPCIGVLTVDHARVPTSHTEGVRPTQTEDERTGQKT